MNKITTKVRSDELSLLAQGIRRALINRGNKLEITIDNNDLWIRDVVTQEIVCIDLGESIKKYIFSCDLNK